MQAGSDLHPDSCSSSVHLSERTVRPVAESLCTAVGADRPASLPFIRQCTAVLLGPKGPNAFRIKADTNLVPLRGKITGEQVECIVGLCVPVQKSRPDRRTEINFWEKEAERVLREQQKPVLQLASLNRQLVVTGPAGTGKTLIAMELARRKAAAGTRTGLLCFNRLVGHWMREQVEKTQPPLPNLVVGPAIKVMAEMAGCDDSRASDS